jgi:8-amino-7-oxononanoate synthase
MKYDVQALETALAEVDSRHLRRRRSTVESFPETGSRAEVIVEGRRLVDFCSNDYLGLARHPDIAHAMSEAALRLGAGSGAAHLVTGHGVEHACLEEELADFTGRERALLFSTGYMANLAVITSLAARGDLVLLDRLSHASLIDAAQLSGARFKRYAHNDVGSAERALAPASLSVIATDGVFSMDGDIAPLPALARLSREHQAWLAVDDAHGLGVLGKSGRGSCEHFGLNSDDVPVLIGTLGKAFGSFGAFVAGSAQLIELLIQKARSYIYTTALPQPVAAATREALKVAQREPWRRQRVLALTARFRNGAAQLGLPLAASETPIQPLMLGSAEGAVSAQRELLDAGFWVSAIRPPTVPAGSARLRITLSAAHTEAQVDALLDALNSTPSSSRRKPGSGEETLLLDPGFRRGDGAT